MSPIIQIIIIVILVFFAVVLLLKPMSRADEEANARAKHTSEEIDISTPDSTPKILVIPTNEELMIAKDTYELTKDLRK